MSEKIEITVLSGVSAGDIFRFELGEGSELTIGRAPENDLVLQDPTVSRKHAQIRFDGSRYLLSDNGSSHGTVHMGFPVEAGPGGERELGNGDEFKIGEAIFRVSLPQIEKVTPPKETEQESTHDEPTKPSPLKDRKILILLLFVALGLGVLLMPEPAKEPPQLGNKALLLPQGESDWLSEGWSRQESARLKA